MKNSIHMLCCASGGQMNSFVITTADEKLIVIDGGYDEDAEKLVGYLRCLTGKEVPRVDAWILSHPHMDHICAFLEIIEKMPGSVDVDRLYYNFPSLQYILRHQPGPSCLERFYKDLPLFIDKAEIMTLGDTLDVGEAHFECLYSPNPELTANVGNNASIILMLTLGGKKTLFLGDCGVEEGECLLEFYKGTDALKADMVQMAHHGQNGADKSVYEAISPTACFWNTPRWLWENDAGGGYNTHFWKTIEVRKWMDDIGVKEHYVMMNGTQVVEL